MFKIVYPEIRLVSDEEIINLYLDALYDGEVSSFGVGEDTSKMAEVLDDVGIITLGRLNG